jgi:cephalosporin hydroxylase
MNTKRSIIFKESESLIGGRYAWCKKYGNYIPAIYSFLTDEEWLIMEKWYADTETKELIGEANIPFMSLVQGLIMGNSLKNIVQLGHYAGYSSLLIGFMLRKMEKKKSFITIDVDQFVSDYTQSWINKAGLQEYVSIITGDSSNPEITKTARQLLGNAPQLVIIDSSHQYEHTLKELDLWYPMVEIGGLLILHDISEYAVALDSTKLGGVKKALLEWLIENPDAKFIGIDQGRTSESAYKDPCGIGIIQKAT